MKNYTSIVLRLTRLEKYLYDLVSKDVNILDGNSDLKRLIRIFDFLKNKK